MPWWKASIEHGMRFIGEAKSVARNSIYRDVLMDHYRKPRNYGDLSSTEVVARGANPRCGDEIEVGVAFDGEALKVVKFRGRGCSVCIASASMMTEAVSGRSRDAARALADEMSGWFANGEGGNVPDPPPALAALSAVREYPARKRCVLLAWEALRDVLGADSTRPEEIT